MNYAKPEITSRSSASSVIQGGTLKSTSITSDSMVTDYKTPPAYEADE
jgi:hypothetical protein